MPIFSQEFGDDRENGAMPYVERFFVGSNGDGTENTYFPVRYNRQNAESQGRIDFVQIYRDYNDSGPSVHGDHKAGLISYWHGCDGAWDGGPRIWYLDEHFDTYRRTLGGAEIWSGGVDDILFHLRGGGYVYQLRSSCPFNITIYYQETLLYRFNGDGRSWFAVPRTLSEIDSGNDVAPTGTSFGNLYNSAQLSGTQRIT